MIEKAGQCPEESTHILCCWLYCVRIDIFSCFFCDRQCGFFYNILIFHLYPSLWNSVFRLSAISRSNF